MGLAPLRALLRGSLLAALLAATGLQARADCTAWPGEPSPLPRLDDRDSQRARWAELRALELTRKALALERDWPVLAHQTWRRVLCIAPADGTAQAAVLRTAPLKVHQPTVARGFADAPAALDSDPWAALDSLLLVAPAPRYRPTQAAAEAEPSVEAPLRSESLSRIQRTLSAAEGQLDAARFDEALETVARARGRLDELPSGRDLHASRVRVEVITATAAAARGRSDEARACLERVLALDPDFRFDPSTTSPKLVRLLDAARAGEGAAR